jgi:hypothetical protein
MAPRVPAAPAGIRGEEVWGERYGGKSSPSKRRSEVMKSRTTFTNAEDMPKIVFHSDIVEEQRKKNGPSPAQIRERAFEIHIEHGGIHGCDLDDWLQAERELLEKYKDKNRGKRK